jgi:single-stranded DNA-binding protein
MLAVNGNFFLMGEAKQIQTKTKTTMAVGRLGYISTNREKGSIPFVAFGATADFILNYFSSGSPISVMAELQPYDEENQLQILKAAFMNSTVYLNEDEEDDDGAEEAEEVEEEAKEKPKGRKGKGEDMNQQLAREARGIHL